MCEVFILLRDAIPLGPTIILRIFGEFFIFPVCALVSYSIILLECFSSSYSWQADSANSLLISQKRASYIEEQCCLRKLNVVQFDSFLWSGAFYFASLHGLQHNIMQFIICTELQWRKGKQNLTPGNSNSFIKGKQRRWNEFQFSLTRTLYDIRYAISFSFRKDGTLNNVLASF